MPLSRPFVGNLVLGGVLLMLAGDFLFALNDALGKWLVASFSVGQVVLVRSIGAFIMLGPMIARQGAGRLFDIDRPLLQVLRVEMGGAADRQADAVRDHRHAARDAIEPGDMLGVVEVARFVARTEVGPQDVGHDFDHVEGPGRPFDQTPQGGLKGQSHAELGQWQHGGLRRGG